MSHNNKKGLIAAIDMGTNTFHMLIARVEENKLIEEFRLRKWVNLAEAGLQHIGVASLQRAWNSMVEFKEIIKKHDVKVIVAVATEGIRSADNGVEFLEKVEKELGINATTISGTREAELIYKGISLLSPGQADQYSLIMDIGGGSTEFILYNDSGIVWSKSYRAGVTYLFNQFVNSDPLSTKDENFLVEYIHLQLTDLIEACKGKSVGKLIGASGSFEVVEMMEGIEPSRISINTVSFEQFKRQYEYLRSSSLLERLEDSRIPDTRAKLIVVAYVFMNYVLNQVNIEQICISPFAMKEGLIRETYNNLD